MIHLMQVLNQLLLRRIICMCIKKKGFASSKLEKWFEKYFGVKKAVGFNSGRGALYAVCKALTITDGDEIIVQAFTCAAVVQAILTTGARIVYADCGSDFTLSLESVKKSITLKTKAIIVQHTFGIPADMNELLDLAKKYKIFLIEDSAHSIGSMYNGKKIGTFGVASIFSFGRDKAFSCVSGGIAMTNDTKVAAALEKFQKHKE